MCWSSPISAKRGAGFRPSVAASRMTARGTSPVMVAAAATTALIAPVGAQGEEVGAPGHRGNRQESAGLGSKGTPLMTLHPPVLSLTAALFALAPLAGAQTAPAAALAPEPAAAAPAAPDTDRTSSTQVGTKTKRLPQEINVNLFRNPSIGLEYRLGAFSSVFFFGHSFYNQRKSDFSVSGSYLRGLNLGHENAAAVEAGYRWMVWKGLN